MASSSSTSPRLDDNLFDVDGLYNDQQSSGEAQLTFTNDLVKAVGGLFYMDSTACGAYDAVDRHAARCWVFRRTTSTSPSWSGLCAHQELGRLRRHLLEAHRSAEPRRRRPLERGSQDRRCVPGRLGELGADPTAAGPAVLQPCAGAGRILPGIPAVRDQLHRHPLVRERHAAPGLRLSLHRACDGLRDLQPRFQERRVRHARQRVLFPGTSNGYNSETADNYELGVKSTLLDDTLLLNLTVFYDPYSNAQIEIAGISSLVRAFADQPAPRCSMPASRSTRALELAVRLAARSGALTFGLNVGYLDSYYKNFLIPCNIFTFAPGCAPGRRGRSTIANDESAAQRTALDRLRERDLHLGSALGHAARACRLRLAQLHARSRRRSRARPISRRYGLLNAGLAFTTTSKAWRFSIDGKNLTNKYYRVAGYDFGPPPIAAANSFIGGVSQIGYLRSAAHRHRDGDLPLLTRVTQHRRAARAHGSRASRAPDAASRHHVVVRSTRRRWCRT